MPHYRVRMKLVQIHVSEEVELTKASLNEWDKVLKMIMIGMYDNLADLYKIK